MLQFARQLPAFWNELAAEELLAECNAIGDDSQGEFDATEDIRRMRRERVSHICQSGA